MKRMKIILKHFIATALLLLIPVVALCCDKASPLIIEDSERVSDIDAAVYKTNKIGTQGLMTENQNVSPFMNEDLIPAAIFPEEWELAGIEYEHAWSYKNNDSENREKPSKQDNWDVVYDPIGFDVFLFVHFVIAGSLLIISCIMTYNFIRDNSFNNLRYEKKN
jgi:hypothetical protein